MKIGVAGPMTGANAAFGEQYMVGAKAAAEVINKAGGINGEKIVLVAGDDACKVSSPGGPVKPLRALCSQSATASTDPPGSRTALPRDLKPGPLH